MLLCHLWSPMVFMEADGRDFASDKRRSRITVATRKAMRDAGIEDASFHSLRHTAAAWMVQAGVSLYEVQNALGHSTPVMTQRYAHPHSRVTCWVRSMRSTRN